MSSQLGFGSHKYDDNEPSSGVVPNTMVFPGWGEDAVPLLDLLFLVPHLKKTLSFEDDVDFIGTLMKMGFLFLAGLKAVKIKKESRGVHQIVLF